MHVTGLDVRDLIGACARGAHHCLVRLVRPRCVPSSSVQAKRTAMPIMASTSRGCHRRRGHPRPDPPRRRGRPRRAAARRRRVPRHRGRLPRRCWPGCAPSAGWSRSGWRAPAPTAPAWPATWPAQGVAVVEVDRPDRKTRRRQGKSDPIDAIAAARAALSGHATGVPKTRTGPVEAIRALRVARRGAVKARTAALNQLHGLLDLRARAAACRPGRLPTTELVAPLRRLPHRPRPAARPGQGHQGRAARDRPPRPGTSTPRSRLADDRLRPA